MKTYYDLFNKIIAPENLFAAWTEFKQGKQRKPDVLAFERNLEENVFRLSRELHDKTYRHGAYEGFYISDPKQRHIHKATVRDRVLHHAIVAVINPVLEPTFIPTSFSCRVGLGMHKGIEALERMSRSVSRNGTRPCVMLKCDIRKFFDNVDHILLLSILAKRIKDADALWLLTGVVESFASSYTTLFERKGVPIGNLTSQLFANVYMNEFDRFMKHVLHVKHYARYTDDFVVVAESKTYLEELLPPIRAFLKDKLMLQLHPKKVEIRTLYQGVDFLGYIIFPHHLLLRTKTKHRMFTKLDCRIAEYHAGQLSRLSLERSLQSYLGVLSHANSYELRQELLNRFWYSI